MKKFENKVIPRIINEKLEEASCEKDLFLKIANNLNLVDGEFIYSECSDLEDLDKKNLIERVKENPFDRKWVVDNYKVSIQDMSSFVKDVEMLPHIKGQSFENQLVKNKRLFKNFLDAFLNKKKIYKIPHIHHRIWITSNDKPVEIPEWTLEMYINSLKTFPKDWKHVFWCLYPEKIPQTIKALKESGVDVEIRSLNDLIKTMPGRKLYERLYEEKYYAAAVDILKRYVVYKNGGLYSDIGIFWKKDPTEYVDTFDRLSNLTTSGHPDLGMFACAANAAIEGKFFEIIDDFMDLPKDVKQNFKGKDIVKLTWIPTLKTLIDSESLEDEKIFYWDQFEKYYREWQSYSTWSNKKGLLGNKPVVESVVEW